MESQDIQALLSPIDGDNPCGIDLRETSSSDYQTLKDARRTIASLVRARKFDSDSDGEVNRHWQTIYSLAPEVIKTQSKDLEVATWFAEASLKLHGYTGLRAAFSLNEGLVENFFDNIYPLPDEDGIETRVYPLIGLNGEDGSGTLILPLKNAPLSESDDTPFTYNLYSRCIEAEKVTDVEAKRQRQNEIGITLEEINKQVNASSIAYYQALIEDLEAGLTHFNNMTSLLDTKCGLADSPPSSAIKKTLEAVLDAIKLLTKTKLAVTPETSNEAEPLSQNAQDNAANTLQQPSMSVGAINSRADALNQLLLVANYFRQTEPHSPLCGALERVVEWGNMSLQELMMALIPDASARANYTQLTGIDLGEGALPIGQLSQSAKVVQPAPAAAPSQAPEQTDQTKDFGQSSNNTNGW
ncbi:MAG: type VI secretion system protein ImpA [Pseudohongiellaceae bacterium]|jgi:type VI secretion system protein ImpA